MDIQANPGVLLSQLSLTRSRLTMADRIILAVELKDILSHALTLPVASRSVLSVTAREPASTDPGVWGWISLVGP